MKFGKQMIADLLFGVQIVGCALFCGAYALRSMQTVEGSSLVQFGLVIAYLTFQLSLSVKAYGINPFRSTWQLVATYTWWLVWMSLVARTVATHPEYRWNHRETDQLLTAIALTVCTLVYLGLNRVSIADPMAKALFAIAYKSAPQVLLGLKFLAEGASGTPTSAIIIGHVTILIRIGQIYFMIKDGGLDRNRLWLAVSETANELSWVIATIAWRMV